MKRHIVLNMHPNFNELIITLASSTCYHDHPEINLTLHHTCTHTHTHNAPPYPYHHHIRAENTITCPRSPVLQSIDLDLTQVYHTIPREDDLGGFQNPQAGHVLPHLRHCTFSSVSSTARPTTN